MVLKNALRLSNIVDGDYDHCIRASSLEEGSSTLKQSALSIVAEVEVQSTNHERPRSCTPPIPTGVEAAVASTSNEPDRCEMMDDDDDVTVVPSKPVEKVDMAEPSKNDVLRVDSEVQRQPQEEDEGRRRSLNSSSALISSPQGRSRSCSLNMTRRRGTKRGREEYEGVGSRSVEMEADSEEGEIIVFGVEAKKMTHGAM